MSVNFGDVVVVNDGVEKREFLIIASYDGEEVFSVDLEGMNMEHYSSDDLPGILVEIENNHGKVTEVKSYRGV